MDNSINKCITNTFLFLLGCSFLAFALSGFWGKEHKPDQQIIETRETVEAWVAAQEAMLTVLKAPLTADFGDQTFENTVLQVGMNEYQVQLYVDANNSYGAQIREHYTVKLKKHPDGWEILSIQNKWSN